MTQPTPFAFFLDHAGYSYQPATENEYAGRVRGALALASAEADATDAGASFDWQIDQDIDSSEWCDERPAWQTWQCCIRDAKGELLNSLGGIDFGRDGEPWSEPYKRVVEAELALESDFTPENEG